MSTKTDPTKKGGRPARPPAEQKKVVPIRLDPGLLQAVDDRRGDQSRNAWVEEAIREKLGGAHRPMAEPRASAGVRSATGGGSKQQYTCATHGTVNLGRCTTIGCTATQRPIR